MTAQFWYLDPNPHTDFPELVETWLLLRANQDNPVQVTVAPEREWRDGKDRPLERMFVRNHDEWFKLLNRLWSRGIYAIMPSDDHIEADITSVAEMDQELSGAWTLLQNELDMSDRLKALLMQSLTEHGKIMVTFGDIDHIIFIE